MSNRNVDILREFVKEQGLPYFYDVIDDPNGHWHFDPSKGQHNRQYGSKYTGVCHTTLHGRGTPVPGRSSSGPIRTPAWPGAFNQFATGIGNTDAGFILGTGKLLIKVPETMRFYLEGEMQRGSWRKT
jgi:3-isopropylmalate/(R)-2-methylmalate dehydratase large subunit